MTLYTPTEAEIEDAIVEFNVVLKELDVRVALSALLRLLPVVIVMAEHSHEEARLMSRLFASRLPEVVEICIAADKGLPN